MTSTCTRCQGLLTLESIPRRRRAALQLLACMACGDRIDATILANRRFSLARHAIVWQEQVWQQMQRMVAQEVMP